VYAYNSWSRALQSDHSIDLHDEMNVNQSEQIIQDDFYLMAIAEIRSMMTNEMTAMASPESVDDGLNLLASLQGEEAYSASSADQDASTSDFHLGGLAHDILDNSDSDPNGVEGGQQVLANLPVDAGNVPADAEFIIVATTNGHHTFDAALLHDALPEITGNGLQDMMNLTSLLEDAHMASQSETDWRNENGSDNFGYSPVFTSFLSSGTSFEDHGSFSGMEFAKPDGAGGGKGGGGGGGGSGGGGGGGGYTPLSEYTSGVDGGYNIHITFEGDWGSNSNYQYLQQAFVYGADLLSSIITGHMDQSYVDPGIDLDITVSLMYIDGRGNPITGNILGWAEHSPGSDSPYYYSTTATIAFDSYDVDQDLNHLPKNWDTSDFTWDDVAVHEMIHALGFASDTFDLIGLIDYTNPSAPLFTGSYAVADYGGGVPLEAGGGAGTALSHWSEAAFGDEIMTGYVGTTPTTLSTLTVAAFQDLGYDVVQGFTDTVIDSTSTVIA
jgi:hypothetical protein